MVKDLSFLLMPETRDDFHDGIIVLRLGEVVLVKDNFAPHEEGIDYCLTVAYGLLGTTSIDWKRSISSFSFGTYKPSVLNTSQTSSARPFPFKSTTTTLLG